jgi:hypothetical protein
MPVSNKKTNTKTLKDETWATLRETVEILKRVSNEKEEFRKDMKKSSEEFRKDMKKSNEEFRKDMKKSNEKHDREMEEFRKDMKKSSEKYDREMEKFRENLGKSSEDFRKDMKKSSEKHDREMEEFRENIEKSSTEFRKDMKKSSEELYCRMREINELIGSWDNNIGDFAEEYFQNSFDKGKTNFFGKRFYKLERNLPGIKPKFEDEYDIVLINGKYVGIIEVKFKGHVNDISKILKKVNTFRENFPYYGDRKIYLGLASMSFHSRKENSGSKKSRLEEECEKNGIAIIKQVGDKVVIIDEHLKAY